MCINPIGNIIGHAGERFPPASLTHNRTNKLLADVRLAAKLFDSHGKISRVVLR